MLHLSITAIVSILMQQNSRLACATAIINTCRRPRTLEHLLKGFRRSKAIQMLYASAAFVLKTHCIILVEWLLRLRYVAQ